MKGKKRQEGYIFLTIIYYPYIFFNQKSSHCEYIDADNAINCYVRAIVNSIEREISVNVAYNDGTFELESQVHLHPESIPIGSTLRIIPNRDATVIFAHFRIHVMYIYSSSK